MTARARRKNTTFVKYIALQIFSPSFYKQSVFFQSNHNVSAPFPICPETPAECLRGVMSAVSEHILIMSESVFKAFTQQTNVP
jgi:hypothetical protein